MNENQPANGFTGATHVPAEDATLHPMVIRVKMLIRKLNSKEGIAVKSEILRSRSNKK